MASFAKFNAFVEHLAEKVHNLGSDTLKVLLTLTSPSASNSVTADLVEIAAGNGYLQGGTIATQTGSAQTSGTYKLTLTDVVFTASGGTMTTFRYAVLYNDTPSSPLDPLIGYWDNGSTVSLISGQSFTVDFDASAGVLTIT